MDTGTPSADFENSAFWIKFTKVNDIIFMSALTSCLFVFFVETKAAQITLCSPLENYYSLGFGSVFTLLKNSKITMAKRPSFAL